MKIFLTGVLLLLCGISTIAQRIALPAIYKGEDVTSSTKAVQLKPLLSNSAPVISNTLVPMTGRFLTEFCIPRGPFDFVKLSAVRTDAQNVALQFETTNEYTSNSFIIERVIAKGTEHAELRQPEDTCFMLLYKTGALSDFDQVNKRYAKNKGAANAKYELTDQNNYSGISFYRITEVDYDQTTVSSRIVAVMGTPLKESLSLYPNPAASQTSLSLFSKTADNGTVQLLSAQGVLLKEMPMAVATGNNNVSIAVGSLPAGLYYIRIVRKHSPTLQSQFVKM